VGPNLTRQESLKINCLRSSPTNACPSLILEGEDYGLKVSINVHSQSGVRAMQVSGPLEHDVMRLQGLIADEHYR